MPTDKKYLLDANVFIEAKRRYYAFDLCPGYWECLVWHHQVGCIQSIDRVKEEFERGADELFEWAKSVMPQACFVSCDEEVVTGQYAQIMAWVQSPEAKAAFAASADGWLIAFAKAKSLVLVTHEVLAPDARKNVPIPNVCEVFSVPYVDTFEMLRDLEAKFEWRHHS
jgi:hypothetical protein